MIFSIQRVEAPLPSLLLTQCKFCNRCILLVMFFLPINICLSLRCNYYQCLGIRKRSNEFPEIVSENGLYSVTAFSELPNEWWFDRNNVVWKRLEERVRKNKLHYHALPNDIRERQLVSMSWRFRAGSRNVHVKDQSNWKAPSFNGSKAITKCKHHGESSAPLGLSISYNHH